MLRGGLIRWTRTCLTAVPVLLPTLSPTMTEGRLVKWLKKVGDTVTEGDVLAQVETDKSVVDFTYYDSGVLAKLCVQDGALVPLGGMIAVIVDDVANMASAANVVAPPLPPRQSAEAPASPAPPVVANVPPPAPAAATTGHEDVRGLIRRSGPAAVAIGALIDDATLQKIPPTGKGGRFTKADLIPFVSSQTVMQSTTDEVSRSPSSAPSLEKVPAAEPRSVGTKPGLVVDFSISDTATIASILKL